MSFQSTKKGSALGTLMLSLSVGAAQQVSFQKAETNILENSRNSERIFITLSEAATNSINVPFRISGTASSQDYNLSQTNQVYFNRGSTSAYIDLRMRDDRTAEGKESFTIELLPKSPIQIGNVSKHVVNIEDDEGEAPRLSFSTKSQRVTESGQQISVVVHLDKPASDSIRIQLGSSGSAVDRKDYQISNTNLYINRGQQEATTNVTITNDTENEKDENININFKSVTGAQYNANDSLVFTIEANDLDTAWTQTCSQSTTSGLSYKYCVIKTAGSRSQDVLYYWHGAFGSEKEWTSGAKQEFKQGLRVSWDKHGVDAPTVIAISLGTLWMLNDYGNGGADFATMADKIIPAVEQRVIGTLKGRRLLMGISMGGFNASQLLFKRPQLWDRAVLVAPLMPPCDPYMPEELIYACLFRIPYKSNAYIAMEAHKMVQDWFLPHQWDLANPLNLGKARLNANSVPTLLTSGTNDDFAFYTKNKELGEYGRTVSPMEWVSTEGDHGYFDIDLVSEFLAK